MLDDMFSEQEYEPDSTTRFYVRILDGNVELIRVEPFLNDDGDVVPNHVLLFRDNEEEPVVMSQEAAYHQLAASSHKRLEEVLNYKSHLH